MNTKISVRVYLLGEPEPEIFNDVDYVRYPNAGYPGTLSIVIRDGNQYIFNWAHVKAVARDVIIPVHPSNSDFVYNAGPAAA